MSFNYTIDKHATAGVSKLLATSGGAHIYNVTLTSDTDNGNIIKRGAWADFNNYTEAAASTFNGIIRSQAANGNWYVEVLEDLGFDALLVYNPPVVEADWTQRFAKESNFYLKTGEVARAHELKKGDIFEVSAEAFSGTPAANKTITTITNKKLVVGA